MRRRKKRDLSIFSLSFLDCICCGFGAVILLFIISMGSERVVVEKIRQTLRNLYQQRLTQLEQLSSERETLQQQMQEKKESEASKKQSIAALQVQVEEFLRRLEAAQAGRATLLASMEEIKKHLDVREEEVDIPQRDSTVPIGLPVASNHLIFILDTSGSMRDPRTEAVWDIVQKKIFEALESYPIVKGIQFLDADGNYILRESAGKWLPDSLGMRAAFQKAIRRYDYLSNSNPIPGIVRAVKTFSDPADPGKKIGLYIFGDEFTWKAEKVLKRLDKLNPPGANGVRPITINAIGFPHVIKHERHFTQTGLKFAHLMRELTREHGGAFIGIED